MNNKTWKIFVLLLKHVAEQKKITQVQIAEKCKMHQPAIARIFALIFCPSLHIFLKICNAVEINFLFEDKQNQTGLNILFEKAIITKFAYEIFESENGYTPNSDEEREQLEDIEKEIKKNCKIMNNFS